MTTGAQIVGIDLFCGVGGLTHGLAASGIEMRAGYDIDPDCRFPFERNNSATFVEADVSQVSAEDLRSHWGDAGVRLLAGCAPCQPFSTYRRSAGKRGPHADWQLLQSFGNLVRDSQPELVTMENVPQLADHEVFEDFLAELRFYEVAWGVVDCASIGVPQSRKRLVLIASRLGLPGLQLPVAGGSRTTVRDAIGGLPQLEAGQEWDADPLHCAPRLSPLNLRRIRASKPGGTWRDWPKSLQATCHRRTSGATYPSVYGRMEWDDVAPTITTQCFGYGNGRFGHPEQDRAISLREAAMLQTFPASYRFVDDGSRVRFNRLGRLIGNAVPVKLGRSIGDVLVQHVGSSPSGEASDS